MPSKDINLQPHTPLDSSSQAVYSLVSAITYLDSLNLTTLKLILVACLSCSLIMQVNTSSCMEVFIIQIFNIKSCSSINTEKATSLFFDFSNLLKTHKNFYLIYGKININKKCIKVSSKCTYRKRSFFFTLSYILELLSRNLF